MQNLFTRELITGEFCLDAGQTHATRLAPAARVKVSHGLVWLTLEQGGGDIWLHAGQEFELPGGGLAVFEAAGDCARFQVLGRPATGVAHLMRWFPHGLLRW
ncbi:DUF2917 domain-containing protein [Herbaspirillum sp. YR522]|uniref:DUF2917 domain-containing protein n=1 Tax=Herbaspirillum sp. YR522 TaxID=1144342 RepID=UPI00026F4B2F|nr:DUF2917 domain-containing protein [Herbaspirillum sp. YR522]EJM97476.1 Protein of unknown function (DUF2917) [Herbaspirillum sp. YR522]